MTTPHGTDWGQYGLADIWDMVRDDNFNNHAHVMAWEKMRILCDGMAGSLKAAAVDLAERWPPDQSPAAVEFKVRLEKLADTFSRAGRAAGANGPTLAGVNSSFASSRGKIVNLCRSWEQTERDEAARVAIARRVLPLAGLPLGPLAAAAGAVVIDAGMSDRHVLALSNTVPSRYAVNAAGAPSVPTDWRQQHDTWARDVMSASDREITDAHARIQPTPVLDANVREVEWPPPGGGVGGVGITSSGFSAPPAWPIPPGLPERSPAQDAPILDGGVLPGPGTSSGGQLPTGGALPAPSGAGSVPWVTTPTGRALAPGAVFGERLPTPRVPLGAVPGGVVPMSAASVRATGGAASGGFVAPPGGLIGGASAGRGGMPVGGAAVPRGARRRGDDDGNWVVQAGVPGVLEPDPEPTMHDPGPGVIGIDR